jgi:hypothetical protein
MMSFRLPDSLRFSRPRALKSRPLGFSSFAGFVSFFALHDGNIKAVKRRMYSAVFKVDISFKNKGIVKIKGNARKA